MLSSCRARLAEPPPTHGEGRNPGRDDDGCGPDEEPTNGLFHHCQRVNRAGDAGAHWGRQPRTRSVDGQVHADIGRRAIDAHLAQPRGLGHPFHALVAAQVSEQ